MTVVHIAAAMVILANVVMLNLMLGDPAVGIVDLCKVVLATALIGHNLHSSDPTAVSAASRFWGFRLPVSVSAAAFVATLLTSRLALARPGLSAYVDGMAAYVVAYVAVRVIDWIRRN